MGVAQQRLENPQLFLDEEPDRPLIGWELLRNRNHRRFIPVTRSESVVHVTICQRRHLAGKADVTLLLARIEPHVFEHDDPARRQLFAGRSRQRPDSIVDLHNRPANQLLQPRGHPVHPVRSVLRRIAGRTPQMTDQDQAAAALQNVVERRQRASDPAVVGNPPVSRLRDIEVDADQHLATRYFQFAHRSFGHEVSLQEERRTRPPAPAIEHRPRLEKLFRALKAIPAA